ncbi:cytochrome d ubiquinol oxidase subunit II [Campylobacter sputorum]|uniref:cytochrome d ubiquinol oxidase subunit II n=1 Tax=Campylobacter sputorum TaxID=206 RepID=UPI000B781DDC|nr:cytochrome d ubiquinol oxidase subunit II [Campylobacter sputorum]ASM37259.1 cyanide-insensitive cytochrome oxidase CioAB, subunit II [Campylobacter sputorum bv. faecalis CCUG 20703]
MYETYQLYWWFIVSLLAGIFVFMMFVQGGQTLIFCLSENELHKDMIVNSIGKKWELTFTTLVMFGGACFAAFPLFYATSFGGAYWIWMAILFCFIIQAVAYEYRKKPHNFLGQKTYEIFLLINGSVGVFLIGLMLSTFFSGNEFKLNETNFVLWQNSLRGLEIFKNPFNYILGITLVFSSRVGGNLYLMNNIDDEYLNAKFRKSLKVNFIIFLLFFILFLLWIFTKDGFMMGEDGIVVMKKYQYILNFINTPILLVTFVLGLILVSYGIYKALFAKSNKGIFFYGLGIVMAVTSLFFSLGLSGNLFYPSYTHLQSSLSIYNSSSSLYTLRVMSVISVFIPFVLAYIIYVWRAMDKVKLTSKEIQNDEHIY